MNYQQFGLDKYLRSANGPVSKKRDSEMNVAYELLNEVQTKTVTSSTLDITNLIGFDDGSGASSDFSSGSILEATSTVNFSGRAGTKNFMGIPFVTIYQGTAAVAGSQIWPNSSSDALFNRYEIRTGWDRHTYAGSVIKYIIGIRDTTGTNSTPVFFRTGWQYVNYTANRQQF